MIEVTVDILQATNLIKAGYKVVVWNWTKSACEPLQNLGATVAETPAQLAMMADYTFAMLAGVPIVPLVKQEKETISEDWDQTVTPLLRCLLDNLGWHVHHVHICLVVLDTVMTENTIHQTIFGRRNPAPRLSYSAFNRNS